MMNITLTREHPHIFLLFSYPGSMDICYLPQSQVCGRGSAGVCSIRDLPWGFSLNVAVADWWVCGWLHRSPAHYTLSVMAQVKGLSWENTAMGEWEDSNGRWKLSTAVLTHPMHLQLSGSTAGCSQAQRASCNAKANPRTGSACYPVKVSTAHFLCKVLFHYLCGGDTLWCTVASRNI